MDSGYRRDGSDTIAAECRKRESEIRCYAIMPSLTAWPVFSSENSPRTPSVDCVSALLATGTPWSKRLCELLEAGLARADSEPENLGEAIRPRSAPLGGADLKIPPRGGTNREIQFK